jgi:hypothetical protein
MSHAMRTLDQQENHPVTPIDPGDAWAVAGPDQEQTRDKPARDELLPGFAYDLRIGRQNSLEFYAEVAAFSARVVAEIERRAPGAMDGYSRYLPTALREAPRTRGEYALELLTAGMAIRLYGDVARRTPAWVMGLARKLFALRRRSPRMKRLADFLRAGVFQIFMRRKGHRAGTANYMPNESEYARLPRLIEWLQATGEFEQEWRRIANWRAYWRELPSADAENSVILSLDLFDWFTGEADKALGKYTSGVHPFLENAYAKRFWREDQLFCGRLPAEYHLGMVAAEVMNEGLRDEFRKRPRKVLLVPACMRGARAETCKAVTRDLDITCAGCNPDCAVNRITRRMRRERIPVYMVPHSSGFSRWLERWQSDPGVGVAAVACMMNILAGGLEMRARGIASQCVPLDFPGCEKHWKSEPVATSLNEERLVQIVSSPR